MIERRVAELQAAVLEMQAVLAMLLARVADRPVRLYVNELQAERLEFHMGDFEIGEVSGQLNIGLTQVTGTEANGYVEASGGDAQQQGRNQQRPRAEPLWPPPRGKEGSAG